MFSLEQFSIIALTQDFRLNSINFMYFILSVIGPNYTSRHLSLCCKVRTLRYRENSNNLLKLPDSIIFLY